MPLQSRSLMLYPNITSEKGSVMSHPARLRKVGGSVMLAIPKPVLEALDLAADASVGLSIELGRIVVEPMKRRRYTLDELLAGCDPKARRAPEDRAWQSGKRAGRELI
jgi:antitoxin ChpS